MTKKIDPRIKTDYNYPSTSNESFDRALKELQGFHPVMVPGYSGAWLLMNEWINKMPTKKEWKQYLSSFQTVLVIGHRNCWLNVHVDRQGYPIYWVIDTNKK